MASSTAALKKAVQSVTKGDQPGVTDQELVRRFVTGGDQAAFAALVGRHTAMVLGVCRRALPTVQDAEDAVQATFLILARKAGRIRWQSSVAGWLYVTARQVTHNARVAARRRARREAMAAVREVVQPLDRVSGRELLATLDEELERLSPCYRDPLVLCYLEGLTRDEAAARLGVSVKTLHSRVDRGRKKLHDALTTSGCAMGAGLLALAVTSPAGASPPRLVRAVLAAASGSAPAAVAELAKGVAVKGIVTKSVLALAAMIGVVALGIGLGAFRSSAQGQTPEKPAPPAGQPLDQPAPPAPATVKITGSYSDPDKRPEPGATVAVWARGKKLGETTTTRDTMFQVTVPGPLPADTKIVATKTGFAPDWANVPANPSKTQVELRAVSDETALDGRVTDLQGLPVANLPVDVERIGRPKPGHTLDEHIKLDERPYFDDLDSISAQAAGLPTRVTTDKDGRFKITGVGKDRSARITTRGETTEHLQVRVVTRDIDPKLEQHKPFGLHGAKFTLLVGPSRPIVGTVRDSKTGDPVPGMQVVMVLTPEICKTTTDKDGRYQLFGLKKEKQYWLAVGSLGEAPYFDANVTIDDTPGLGPIPLDIEVHRGIVVTGRVTDSAGKPVAGFAFYDWAVDNPHLKDFPGIQDAIYVQRPWASFDRDGRYKLLVMPGPGTIGVCARPEDAFTRLNRQQLVGGRPNRFPHDPIHAVAEVDVNPKDPKTLTRDFTLTSGQSRALAVRGADGKLPEKLLAVGQSKGTEPTPVAGDTLKVTGLSPKGARAVVLIDEAKTVGAVAAVTGDAETPVNVTLEKLGSVTGRVLAEEGGPVVGAEVRLWLILDGQKYENLPSEYSELFGVQPSAWREFTGRATKTDKDGRFTLTGLLPGQQYRLAVGFKLETGDRELLHLKNGVKVKPGEASALGDLKPEKSP